MDRPQPNRAEIHQRTDAQPPVWDGETISKSTADAIYEDLIQSGSAIPKHLRDQIDTIFAELQYEFPVRALEEKVSVNQQIIRGLIARAVRAGAGQVISDTGKSNIELLQFEHALLELSQHKDETNPLTGDGDV